ncbi:hypothetical protein ER308_12950 [Egibacter rhizosphaerae]|uniref:SRPBCC family protein n=1 Tax=Egibacter rhizosphaerae TaxID=1670831 RepID=A0A411YGJ9_9ACTN|nr:SRPBCC domain-containing protein [Egibacter rhizosphaerae]QBI20384.1 hypothetical protein ER308_12950 [Egibacter rhizosphaerae]
MPSSTFERDIQVGSPADRCWAVLTDVERVAGWVTIADEVREHEYLAKYTVVLADQFGPFSVYADIDVDVTDVEEHRFIRFTGKGKDRKGGSSIRVEATMALEEQPSGTTIAVSGKYSVLGTIATMGSSTVRQKADGILDEFFTAASEELAAA